MRTLAQLACIASLSLVTSCSSEEERFFPPFPECFKTPDYWDYHKDPTQDCGYGCTREKEFKLYLEKATGDCSTLEVFRGTLNGLPVEYSLSQTVKGAGAQDIKLHRSCFVHYENHLIYSKSCGSSSVDHVDAFSDVGEDDATATRKELEEAGKLDYYEDLLTRAREEIFLPQAEQLFEEEEKVRRAEEHRRREAEEAAKAHRQDEVRENF